MAGYHEININEPPPSDKIDADKLHPFNDSMALAIIQTKELAIVPSKELAVIPPKEIVPAPKPQAFYTRTIPCLTLAPSPPRFTVEGKLGKPKVLTFCIPKDLNLLLPRPNEMLTELKTNKFGDVTCMKYKKTTSRVTLDGVQAMPEQIKVVPPKKRPSSSFESSEPKHQKTTLATLEKMEELEQKITRIQQDLAFLAGAIDRLTARMDKATIKHQGLKSHVNIISRTVARRLEN
jgi:hypothetical protein